MILYNFFISDDSPNSKRVRVHLFLCFQRSHHNFFCVKSCRRRHDSECMISSHTAAFFRLKAHHCELALSTPIINTASEMMRGFFFFVKIFL